MDTCTELERAITGLIETQNLPGLPAVARAHLADNIKIIRDVARHHAGQQREAICQRAVERFVERTGSWRP